ncbi:hypothetical protein GGH96_004237 [Coemansia sp. RSA 1972]|nr:hypothetical protein GGH96_004237 [Coemansia sp. RSA 1972]
MDRALARPTVHTGSSQLLVDSATTDIDRLASVSGVISPFHARKSPLRVPRPPMPPQALRSDIYNRVRRRSPLCHDVLEFMLEGASVSSQESLVSDGVASNGAEHTVSPDAYAAHSNAPPSLRSSEAACVGVGQPNGRNSTSNTAFSANTAHVTGAEQGVHVECQADSHAPAEHPHWSEQSDNDDGDCGSDASGDGDSDNGFDGQCDGMSLTATTESTAECSRSGSYRSSKSDSSDVSDASGSSTSTEPSLKWWKRHFKSKSKTQLQEVSMPGVLLRRSTVSAHAPHAFPASAASSSSITPMLTRLKRSVSSKSAANKQLAPELKKPRAAAVVETAFPQSKLSRASFISGSLLRSKSTSTKSMQLMPALPNAKPATAASNSACANTAAPTRPQTAGSDSEDAYVARWTMLKCKGMDNLHVVSVPAAIGSLNHKDAFLFYPCLFHTPDPSQPASKPQPTQSTANNAGNLRENDMYRYEAMGAKHMHGGTLLAQEYSRRKSVCLLASRTIYIWLGAHASPIKRDAITRVAMEIRDKELLGKAAVVLVDESAATNSARKKFFAQLHLSEHGDCLAQPKDMSSVYNLITPLRRAGDDLDFERALQRRKVMYGFWEAVPPATIIAAGTYVNAAALSKVPAGGAIVLDTWSDVFIWWRNEPCSPAVRRCAINFANMLIKDVSIPPRPQSASVWHEAQGSEHVIFKTKFPDWPFVFASSMGSIEVARQMTPASSSAPPPMALPIRSVSRQIRPIVAV